MFVRLGGLTLRFFRRSMETIVSIVAMLFFLPARGFSQTKVGDIVTLFVYPVE